MAKQVIVIDMWKTQDGVRGDIVVDGRNVDEGEGFVFEVSDHYSKDEVWDQVHEFVEGLFALLDGEGNANYVCERLEFGKGFQWYHPRFIFEAREGTMGEVIIPSYNANESVEEMTVSRAEDILDAHIEELLDKDVDGECREVAAAINIIKRIRDKVKPVDR